MLFTGDASRLKMTNWLKVNRVSPLILILVFMQLMAMMVGPGWSHFHTDENVSPLWKKIPWTTVPNYYDYYYRLWWFLLKIDASVCGQLCFFFSLKTFYLLYPRLKRT